MSENEINPPVDEAPVDKPEEDTPRRGANLFEQNIAEVKELKRRRLKAILEFARTEEYTNQQALADYLAERGLGCLQPAISKHLDLLGMAPYIDRNGIRRLGRKSKVISDSLSERYVKMFAEVVLDVNCLGETVVLRTIPYCGMAAAAVVEANNWPEVMTITYGLSCVNVLCYSYEAATSVIDRIKEGIL